MGRDLEKETLIGFARNDRRTFTAAFQDTLRTFQIQLGLGFGTVVTSNAVRFEKRVNLFREINRLRTLEFSNGNRRQRIVFLSIC